MTTEFYSTKRNANVNIKNDKVCGYKIKNNNARHGWQSGMRAGRDNGVVNQRFSRFSTDEMAADRTACDGNTNWLNYKGPVFNAFPEGTQVNINRRRFLSGTQKTVDTKTPTISGINKRVGLGNYDITRSNFIAPPIKGREVGSFARLQAGDLASFNNEVELGTKTLKRIFDIRVADPLDKKWLDEKIRITGLLTAQGLTDEQITRELDVNKPLGREQRTKAQKSGINASKFNLGSQLAEVIQEIKDGNVNSQTDRAAMTAQLIQVLARVGDLETLSARQFSEIQRAIVALGVPVSHKLLSLPRYVDLPFYNANKGIIHMFLYSAVSRFTVLTANKPIANWVADPANGSPPITLGRMADRLRQDGGGSFFLDLEDGTAPGIVSKSQVEQDVDDGDAVHPADFPPGFDISQLDLAAP